MNPVVVIFGFFVMWALFAIVIKKIKNSTKVMYLGGSFILSIVCLAFISNLIEPKSSKVVPQIESTENKQKNDDILVKVIVNKLGGYNVQTYCKLATVKPNFNSCISTYSNDLFLNQLQSSINEFIIGQISTENIKNQEDALRYAEERIKLNE